jgi:hypothetical protein
MQEEVVVISQECKQLISDEQQASVDCIFVDFVSCEETLVLDLSYFLVEFCLGGFGEFELHYFLSVD